jgi:paired amphipathic helix protein Sin3a
MRDETTFDLDDMERMERWQYYTSSYVRIEPTEGIPRNLLHKTVLTRNLPSPDADIEEIGVLPKPLVFDEDLTLRICVNTYKMLYKYPGSEFFIYTDKTLGNDPKTKTSAARERLQKFEDARKQRFKEKFEMNNAWMKGLNHDQVSKITRDFKKWTEEGILPGQDAPSASGIGDVEMA